MGVVYWLDRIDPGTWEAATERLAGAGENLLSRDGVIGFLREFGRQPSAQLLELLDDCDDSDLEAAVRNQVLEAAVAEEQWDLDKSLRELGPLVRALPDAAPLADLFDFQAMDLVIPDSCRTSEGGLWGCISAQRLAGCRQVVERYRDPASVAAALRELRPGLLARLTGRAARVREMASLLDEPYHYHPAHWTTLCEAVSQTLDRGHQLGLGMSG